MDGRWQAKVMHGEEGWMDGRWHRLRVVWRRGSLVPGRDRCVAGLEGAAHVRLRIAYPSVYWKVWEVYPRHFSQGGLVFPNQWRWFPALSTVVDE